MKMKILVKILVVLTVILLAVSFTFLIYQWYLINGLSITIFLFPITVVKVNPLGVVFFEQPLYVTNPSTKLALDLLFLVPYSLSILGTGFILVSISPFSGVAGYEKFRDAVKKLWTITSGGTREQRKLIISGILPLVALYLVAVSPFFIGSKTVFLSTVMILLPFFMNGIIGLAIAGMQLQKIRKTI
ncbi:MAG: hypothetical protein ACUVXA_14540 [Candidatus Jordarchaeum sp.]|uniref:hypothetical protein n=1 Tax=Candidatus Jordarchaeum sp. TaxID=2823881 RepID=UPI00404976FB